MREREVTCVWCGFQFKSTLQSQAEHLYEHAKYCYKHPVKIANDQIDRLNNRLQWLGNERDSLRTENAALMTAMRSGLDFVRSYKESVAPPGCIYCGFASKKCELDEWIETVDALAKHDAAQPTTEKSGDKYVREARDGEMFRDVSE